MAIYNSKDSPKNLSMNDILSASNALGPLAKSCRFAVVITPQSPIIGENKLPTNNDLMYMCEAVEFPGRGFDVTQIRYYGPSQVFPNNTMYNTANMSFLCRSQSPERAFFDDWMDLINPTSNFNYEYPDNYYSTINIYQFAEYGAPTGNTKSSVKQKLKPLAIYGWTLHRAWPTLVAPQQATWADQDVLRLQVTFTYKYWDRPEYSK